MSAIEDVDRIFLMVSWLAQRPGIGVKEAATHWGITPDRLIDELNRMYTIGSSLDAIAAGSFEYLLEYDLDEAEQLGRISLTPSQYISRPLAFTHSEALSLIVALRSVKDLVDDDARAHVESALQKLEGLTSADTTRVDVRVDPGADSVRSVITKAIKSGQRLRLVYDGISRGVTTRPVVDPAALVVRNGAPYLHAWSLERAGWRLYKVNRIAEATPTGDPVGDHGQVPALEWVDAERHGSVDIELAPGATYLLEYDPVRETGALTDGGRYVAWARIPVASRSYLTNRLLGLADDIRLVELHEAQQDAVEIAEAALGQYARLAEVPGG